MGDWYPDIKSRRQMERGFVWWELDTALLELCKSSNSDIRLQRIAGFNKILRQREPADKVQIYLVWILPSVQRTMAEDWLLDARVCTFLISVYAMPNLLVPKNARILAYILRGISILVRQVAAIKHALVEPSWRWPGGEALLLEAPWWQASRTLFAFFGGLYLLSIPLSSIFLFFPHPHSEVCLSVIILWKY